LQVEQLKITEKHGCLSHKRLMQYSAGFLSEKEKSKIENHLLGCEQCISALQGVLEEKDTLEANRIFAELFEEPFKIKKIHKSPRKAPLNYSRIRRGIIFSVLTIIICLGIFISTKFLLPVINKSEGAFDLKQSSKISEKSNIQIENPAVINTNNNEVNIQSTNDPEPISDANSEATNLPDKKPDKKATFFVPAENKKLEEMTPDKNPLTHKPIPERSDQLGVSVVKNDSEDKRTSKASSIAEPVYINNYKISLGVSGLFGKGKIENYKNQFADIFSSIDNSQYAEAVNTVQKVLIDHPADINGKYYRGYIYYLAQDNEKALADFEFILNNTNKTFYEDAHWYKILIFNRNGRFDESAKMLNEIIAENGSYYRKAKQLLDLIGGR
jgi:hypothetical protein